MRRFLLISVLVLAVLLMVLLGLAFWLLNDEAFLKEQLAKYTREFTGRELVIAGPLDLSLGRETTVEASTITLGNAPWADDPNMLEVGHVRATIEIFSLFSDLVYLPYLLLEDCAVEILVNEAGEGNWDFPGGEEEDEPEEQDEGRLSFALREVVINDCGLLYDEPERTQELDVRIVSATLERALHERVVGKISGSVNGEALEVDGWLAPARAFIEGGELRHELNFRAGEVTLESTGTIGDLKTFSDPDFRGHFRGPDIARFLSTYSLAPISEGPFDFRAGLTTRDGKVLVDVDGDLGSLDMTVDAELDSLAEPGEGFMRVSTTGPDLHALGQAVGIEGLVTEPFSWASEFRFGNGVVRIEQARLETTADRLDVSGVLSTQERLAGSDLQLSIVTDEAGRWAPLLNRPEEELGAVSLEGDAVIDPAGILSIDASAAYRESALTVRGIVGPVGEKMLPDLDFEFRSSNMPRLAELIGYQGFPARPFGLKGHARREDQTLHLTDLELSLDRTVATASGQLNLSRDYSGSRIDAEIDIPDAAELGLLFGVDDLVHERLHVVGTVTLESGGLEFDIDDGSLGATRLQMDGRIPDLAHPASIEANFDVRLPGLRFLTIWLPNLALPPGAFEARGRFVNRDDRTQLEAVQLRLGEMEGTVTGHITPEAAFDLDVAVSGPDVTALETLTSELFPPLPFAASGRLSGGPKAFGVDGLDLRIGESEVRGSLDLDLGERKRLEGRLASPYLNLNPWTVSEEPEQAEPTPAEAPRYVFDETPITKITGIGVDLDLHLLVDEFELANGNYDSLEIGVLLNEGRLDVRPFSVRGEYGGQFNGDMVLDSSGASSRFDMSLRAENMRMEMGSLEGQDPMTLPTSNINLELYGTGRTRRELAAGLNGKVRIEVGPGKLAPAAYSFLMSDFISELFRALNPFAEKQEYSELECAVAAADIVSGQVSLEPVVIHASQLTIISQGKIDLDTERLNISFNTKQRKGLGLSASDLVNPFIKVGGTMASPSIELDPAGTVVKGGIAVATAGLSILATSLADRYFSSKDPCGKALKEIEEREAGVKK